MFQFVDDFRKRKTSCEISIKSFVKCGLIQILDPLACCHCSVCSQPRSDLPQNTESPSFIMKNAYQRVVRCLIANQSIFYEGNFGIPSHVIVKNGLPCTVVLGNDSANRFLIDHITRSKMEETRSVPSVCNEILNGTALSKRLSSEQRTVFVARGLTESTPTRFMTLRQFKSIFSDNRKHAKSVWKDISHISLCPWVSDEDRWWTISIRYNPKSSSTSDSAAVRECREICHLITKLLQEQENLFILSGRFTFYHSSTDSHGSPWWLADISKLQVASTVPDTSHE